MMKITLNVVLFSLSLYVFPSLKAAEYTVTVRAHHGVETAYKQWQATIDYLSTQLPEHSFILKPIVSLKEITLAAGRGDYDFVLTNPSSFVEINKIYNAKALLTLNNKRASTAQDKFGSVIFTHAGNENILKLEDLKGKTLMAVSESAFGGWRVAWLELLKNNLNPYIDLKSVIFPDKPIQQEVVYAVLDGEVDAGVVRTDQLERMEAAGKIDMRYLRILNNKNIEGFPFFLSTELYPEWVLASMKNVPAKVGFRVARVLQSIKVVDPAAQAGKYVGWKPALNYDSVENLMQELQVGPFAQQ